MRDEGKDKADDRKTDRNREEKGIKKENGRALKAQSRTRDIEPAEKQSSNVNTAKK